jgi:hypothetical protein
MSRAMRIPSIRPPRVPRTALLPAGALALWLCACASPPPESVSVAAMVERPAERALVDGIRDYESGAFEPAERDFHKAIAQGLRDRRDAAVAYKHLAFIACAFNRLAECDENFRAAFAADPQFRLTDTEIGHPIWGPVYRRVAATQAATPGAAPPRQ